MLKEMNAALTEVWVISLQQLNASSPTFIHPSVSEQLQQVKGYHYFITFHLADAGPITGTFSLE